MGSAHHCPPIRRSCVALSSCTDSPITWFKRNPSSVFTPPFPAFALLSPFPIKHCLPGKREGAEIEAVCVRVCVRVQERQFPLFPPWGQTTFNVADLNSGKEGGLSQLSQRVRRCGPLKWLHCLLHWTAVITLHCHALVFHLWSFVAELFVKRLQTIPNGGAFQHQTQSLLIYSRDSVKSSLRNWQKLLSCDAESRWTHEKQSTWHACCHSPDVWTDLLITCMLM